MSEPFSMDRRGLLQRALVLAGATAVAGFSPAALAKAAAAKGQAFFDAPAYSLASAVADTIIPDTESPGAVAAGVPKTLDALIANWASPDRKVELSQALATIDKLGKDAGAAGFAALAPEKRKELLAAHDAAALKPVPQPVPPVGNPIMQGPSYADPGYSKLKELIVVLYYYTETALTTELTYEHAPGEWQPSIPLTPETRAPGGLGLF